MSDNTFRILIVEDDPVMVVFLKEYLESISTISTVTTGQEAIDFIEGGLVPHLVVLDLNIPGIDGFEVLKHIRSNVKFNTMPVIVLSGSTSSEDRVKALQSGADDFMIKPFNPEELKARIQNLKRRFGLS